MNKQILKVRLLCAFASVLFINPVFSSELKLLTSDSDDYQTILKTTKDYYKAWSYTKEDKQYDQAGQYYSNATDNQFWDPLPPLGGHRGWQEYQHVIEKVWLPAGIISAAILFSHDGSFRAWRHGDVIWTSANCLVRAEYSNTSNSTVPCRGSQIWQKENNQWHVVHEHFSTPIVPNGNLFQGQRNPEHAIKVNKVFLKRAQAAAMQWGNGDLITAANRLDSFYYKNYLHLYMPWPPHDGFPDWHSFNNAINEYLSLFAKKISLTINNDLEATQHGDIAWTTATVSQEIEQHNGNTLLANGRQTLIWVKQAEKWLIAYEHLSFPILPKEQ